MAFVSLRQLLDHAAANDYGVPAFNVNNLEQIQAIMQAAQEVQAPVILQASAGARKYAGEAYLRHMVLAAVESHPDIPVVLHQDRYYLFATQADGYWTSNDMATWSFVTPNRWPLDGSVGTAAVYRRAFNRWASALPDGGATRARAFRTAPRLVIGLGGHTVLETGLTLHHTYGTPVLPGTALKGLAAHYCHAVWGLDSTGAPTAFRGGEVPGEAYRALFGQPDEGGLVTFHDAWITPEALSSALCDDVMTPHHGGYYTDTGSGDAVPPADYDDPVPVAYLAVTGTFRAAVTADPLLGPEWADRAILLLERALGDWGIGGKTASGYGRLVPTG